MRPDDEVMTADLEKNYQVLTEAVQTVMRRHGMGHFAYEQLKAFSRGSVVTATTLHGFIATLDIPQEDKQRLLALKPSTYVGYAPSLADVAGWEALKLLEGSSSHA